MKNIILFGATGNAGRQLLEQSLPDERISKVTVVLRKSCGIQHKKLTEIIHDDFLDFLVIEDNFKNKDVYFYCLGVSQLQEKDAKKYEIITHDFTIAAAEILLKNNNKITFCFLSGEGADPSMEIITPNIVTTSEILAKAMIQVGQNGYKKELIVNKEINSLNAKQSE